MEKKVFLIDFDNTCAFEDFPNVGKDVPYAEFVLREIQRAGHDIVLWTCRAKKPLLDAIQWFMDRNIQLTAVNDFTEEQKNSSEAYKEYGEVRKVLGDYIIDDKNFGSPKKTFIDPDTQKTYNCVDWKTIYMKLKEYNII